MNEIKLNKKGNQNVKIIKKKGYGEKKIDGGE